MTILAPSGTARAADWTTETGPFNIIYPLYLFYHLATKLAPHETARAADLTTETGPLIIYPIYLFWLAINV